MLDRAFAPSTYESRLVQNVRRGDAGTYHDWVVAGAEGAVVGYILFTLALHGSKVIGFHLAPLAVHPEFQNQGLGTLLVETSLASSALGKSAVFVLGDPGYYERFGFTEVTSVLCPYDEGNTHFRARRWVEVREPFTIGYVDAFREAEAE